MEEEEEEEEEEEYRKNIVRCFISHALYPAS